ncbi:hypothetical protein AOQ73_24475 [Bradyrhizobium pachyrhizi]|nr:hypothetical protein AOQ73_24475 [Bradyrhizobium pachyrhizi]
MVSHGCRPGQLGIVVDQSRGNGALAFHEALEPQQKIIRAVGKFGALAGMAALAPDCFAFSLRWQALSMIFECVSSGSLAEGLGPGERTNRLTK